MDPDNLFVNFRTSPSLQEILPTSQPRNIGHLLNTKFVTCACAIILAYSMLGGGNPVVRVVGQKWSKQWLAWIFSSSRGTALYTIVEKRGQYS
jgi:hypothetical protein